MSDRKRKQSFRNPVPGVSADGLQQYARILDSELQHSAKRQHFLANDQQAALQSQLLQPPGQFCPTGSVSIAQSHVPAHLHLSSSNSFSSDCSMPQPTQAQRQWSGSFGNSPSSSAMQQSSPMEEDEQAATPSTQASRRPSSEGMLSHSSSAPDLRLLLTTPLPDNQHMFLPNAGSYAGALVPYKGPQQVIAAAKQHQREQLLAQLKAQLCEARSKSDNGHTRGDRHTSVQKAMHACNLSSLQQQADARDDITPGTKIASHPASVDDGQADTDTDMLDAS